MENNEIRDDLNTELEQACLSAGLDTTALEPVDETEDNGGGKAKYVAAGIAVGVVATVAVSKGIKKLARWIVRKEDEKKLREAIVEELENDEGMTMEELEKEDE